MSNRSAAQPTALEALHPSYFALVMATGMLALACHLLRIEALARIFLAISLPAYALLWALTILRAVRFRSSFLADFRSHQRAPGFFTTVAATSIVGAQLELQMGATAAAATMGWLSALLWLVLTYAIFTALIVRPDKPSLPEGINGGWLTAVVATQSVVALGVLLHRDGAMGDLTALALVSLWLAGGMLYIWTIALIFYRCTFFPLAPADLLPPYWINMGAMAISALAGALLVEAAASSQLLASMLPFLKGFTVLFWATATWWIPLLLAFAVWRYVVRGTPLAYDPLYWSAVFPLAMYTGATLRLGQVLEIEWLVTFAGYFVGAAIIAWVLTATGLIRELTRSALGAVQTRTRSPSDG